MKNTDLPARKQDLFFSDTPLADWQLFYDRVFGRMIETDTFEIPTPMKEFPWLILVPRWLSVPRVIEIAQRFYPVELDGADDRQIDMFITHHDRIHNHDYAVRARNGMHADQIHDGKSVDELRKVGVSGITLLEYLLIHLYIYWTSGEHLDEDTLTLCMGSRYVDGGIPAVSWYDWKGLQITWHRTNRKWPTAACREVWTEKA